jgi:hypothetical protein
MGSLNTFGHLTKFYTKCSFAVLSFLSNILGVVLGKLKTRKGLYYYIYGFS